MLQTESPYYQPTPPPPAPFANVVGLYPSDPTYSCTSGNEFSGCDESWALIITKSENIFIAGAGLYSWFSTYTQECIDPQLCQKVLMYLSSNKASVRIQNLITIGAKYMGVMDGKGITAASNMNVNGHPFWSQITILDVTSTGRQFNDLIWIDPVMWKMSPPKFTCSPPCNVKIPPWTGATSTVNYPLLTVSSGAWTSTITRSPITISQWVFETVTITQSANVGKHKRQDFQPFWPTLAKTTSWPAVIYIGPNVSSVQFSSCLDSHVVPYRSHEIIGLHPDLSKQRIFLLTMMLLLRANYPLPLRQFRSQHHHPPTPTPTHHQQANGPKSPYNRSPDLSTVQSFKNVAMATI